jgi:uncharacterized membrane protein YfcA
VEVNGPAETYLFLCGSALLAGVMNAVAGGGTLLTFPALFTVLPGEPVVANGTSTVALLPGSLAGAWGYRRELKEGRQWVRVLMIPSLVGGVIGTLLVTQFDPQIFATLVPWLILAASLLFVAQKPISRWVGIGKPHEAPSGSTVAGVAAFQLLVAVYGGYFGAGIGILMLSSLALMGLSDIHRMNALKTFLAGCINGTSVVVFVAEGQVHYRYALVMAAAAIAGGYLGARVARRLPPPFVRAVVVLIGFSLAGYYFYKQIVG